MKNKQKINLILFSLFLFLLSSCLPEPIIRDIKQEPPKLVISSALVPVSFGATEENLMVVSVTKSFNAFKQIKGNGSETENGEDLIDSVIVEHALVLVSHGGITDTLFHVGEGIYSSLNFYSPGRESLTLFVYDSISKQKVHATTQVLDQVDFSYLNDTTSSDSVVTLKFNIKDNPEEDNWYMVNVYARQENFDSMPFNNIFNPGRLQNIWFFKDSDLETTNEILINGLPGDTVMVGLTNISKEYYMFLKARRKSASGISFITGEPITYPTNVIYGYGFFTAFPPTIELLVID